jgi:hypothetical protein
MLRGYRGVLAALAGLAAAFIALGTGAYFGALNAPHYGYQTEHPAYRTAQTEQGNPSQVDRDRAGLPHFAERIASGPDPADTNEREKRDLAAQESMSVWAFWLLLITAAGTATTIVGTGLLLWQIILTREAVRDTGDATAAMVRQNELASAAQRAWMSIEPEIISLTITEDGVPEGTCVIHYTNIGNTIARDMTYGAMMTVAKPDEYLDVINKISQHWMSKKDGIRSAMPGEALQSRAHFSSIGLGRRSFPLTILICAHVHYKVEGSDAVHTTMRHFEAGIPDASQQEPTPITAEHSGFEPGDLMIARLRPAVTT